MPHPFKRLLLAALCLALLLPCFPAANAQSASNITSGTDFSGTAYENYSFLRDGNIRKYRESEEDATLTLENEAGIGSVYLLFDEEYDSYQITDNTTGETVIAGRHQFLHEFVDLTALFETVPTSVTFSFPTDPIWLSEVYVFTPGQVPDFVQQWAPPLEGKADIVLFTAHGDDDQLFYAGLLPLYAKELDYAVQTVYMTDHRNNTYTRTHEILNGLWAVGVQAYPVMGSFPDFLLESMERTYAEYERLGVSREQLLAFVVENLRRFRPQVAIGHDIAGEYGHGMHMVYTDCLIKALEIANDPEAFPELGYAAWDVPKTYLHLYEENQIVLDYDQPLASFDGMTAFQVTQKLGYPCHQSQQFTWFTRWINGQNNEITKATQIQTYSPCEFGLFRTTVGEDVAKNDFMENLTSYAQQEQLEQERLEQERLEQERLEQERLEQETLEQEPPVQETLPQETLDQQPGYQNNKGKDLLLFAGILCFLVLLVLLLAIKIARQRAKRRRRRRKRKIY